MRYTVLIPMNRYLNTVNLCIRLHIGTYILQHIINDKVGIILSLLILINIMDSIKHQEQEISRVKFPKFTYYLIYN